MQLIRTIEQLSECHRPSVVSIGNYDGVHLGHQHVIKTLLEQSKRLNAPSTVVTFEPLGKEFFNPKSIARLTSLDEKAKLLFDLGVDQVVCIEFNADFAGYSPERFVDDVLVSGLGAQYVCVGDDFRFGKGRAGDFEFLQRSGLDKGFEVTAHETFAIDGARVSSGRVRDALADNDFGFAERLLGRPYYIAGEVSKGQQLGRTIGFPTANIVLPDVSLPVHGVYAVSIESLSFGRQVGVANVGTRPTVDGKEQRLEVHIFDFDQDIYSQKVKVEFHQKIRGEQKFPSFELLQAQIKQDAERALAYFKQAQ